MKHFCLIVVLICLCVAAVGVVAQSTSNIEPNALCGNYAANYTYNCNLVADTPGTPTYIGYLPLFDERFNVVELDDSINKVTSVSRVSLGSTSSGTPNRQYYVKTEQFSEKTTFIGGSISLLYTVTTRCCSSGRGASQHTSWAVNSGVLTLE